jgi:hypothetical protein
LNNPELWWPSAQPTDSKLYSLTTAKDLIPIADLITDVTVTIAPSGAGELVASNLSTFAFPDYSVPWTWPVGIPWEASWANTTTAYNVGLRLSGGVSGRVYTIQVVVTTLAGNSFTYLVGLKVSRFLVGVLGDWPVPPPPSPGFGPALLLGTFGAPIVGALSASATTN